MKQKYIKPAIVMERFDLAQSIAAGCTADDLAKTDSTVGSPSHWNKTECGWMVDSGFILWASTPACTQPTNPNANVDGICYNHPNGGNTIFNS